MTCFISAKYSCVKFVLFLNGPTPTYFLFIFGLFIQAIKFLQQINVKNIHTVYGARIQTHSLLNMSHLPLPLEHGSRPMLNLLMTLTPDLIISHRHQSGRSNAYFISKLGFQLSSNGTFLT